MRDGETAADDDLEATVEATVDDRTMANCNVAA